MSDETYFPRHSSAPIEALEIPPLTRWLTKSAKVVDGNGIMHTLSPGWIAGEWLWAIERWMPSLLRDSP